MTSLLLEKEKVLELKIEIKRKEMYNKAKYLGFAHPEVVYCSQELDKLLNKLLS